jgi:hypothetical protein
VAFATVAATTSANASETTRPEPPLKVARAVVRATDRAPVIETRDGRAVDGHPMYVSYSDRRDRITAAYLAGKLAQGTIDSTLFAASGGCFTREPLAGSAPLSRIAVSLLPLPSATQRVSYELSGRALSWREPATRQHGEERGDVTFDARGRITRSHRAPYTDGRSRVDGETIVLSYPARLPRFVPTVLPRPVCRPHAAANTTRFLPEGGENHRSHTS